MTGQRRPRVRDESGQVLALVAISSVVVLMFAALVIDIGNWFSHKRQLQNRADAGALAAGVEYQKSWAACVSGDAATATAIDAAAHKYAGDLTADPTAVNTETANNSNVDVFTNSTSYDSALSDGGGPCVLHAADDTSAAGYWTDVKVKERNLASFFGSLGIPLTRNIARARVEIRPAISEAGFVPLAIPDYRIVKAQARFINGCTGAQIGTPVPLAPLDSNVSGNPVVAGTTLWVPDTRTTIPNPVTPVSGPNSFQLAVPATVSGTGCGGTGNNTRDYVPIQVQVRVAGRPDIDLNASCATLSTQTSADCFDDLTEIRAYTGGTIRERPVVGNVVLGGSGAAPCTQDPYYARLQAAQSNCLFSASATIDWDTRPGNANTFVAVLKIGSSSTAYPLTPVTAKPASGKWVSEWVATGLPIGTIGAKDIRIEWEWNGPGNGNSWTPTVGAVVNCTNGNSNPCDQEGTLSVHRVSLGDDPTGNTEPTADIVALAEVTYGPNLTSQLGSTQATGSTISPFLFVGLRSAITAGQFGILRNEDSQGSQSLVCDPDYTQGKTFQMFLNGCKPPYGYNDFTDPNWWNTGTQHCPSQGGWFQQPNSSGNYPSQPWKCIPTEPGGHGFQIVDGLAARTGNCNNIQNNSCQGHNYTCNNAINYQGVNIPVDPGDPRIIKIYVIPYGALRGTTGNDEIPVIDFAAFYVTAYKRGNSEEPCSGNDNSRLTSDDQVGGYFIRLVGPSTGPVDPNLTCDPNAIRVCRAVLVR